MAVTEEISPLEKKIIRQVEYYFGDYNLTRDKFLKETVKENDGWVSMETMLKFKRLASLTTDVKEILAALKKSSSGLMEMTEEGDAKIRRSPSQPLPDSAEDMKKILEARTAYAKGYNKENTTMDELLEYYADNNPAVVNIQMRNYFDSKDKKKNFKGSVFLTFKTEEDCKAFVEAENQEYKGTKLEKVKYQKDYFEEKNKEYEERKKKKGKKEPKANDGNTEKKEDESNEPLPKGAVIKITGLGGEITREDIKDKLAADFGVNIDRLEGDIAFVTYQKGEEEAKIRFKVENFGKTLMEKIDKVEKLVIMDRDVKASLLEGEEEEAYLVDALKELKNMRNSMKNKSHKRKGGFGKGQGGHAKKFKKQ